MSIFSPHPHARFLSEHLVKDIDETVNDILARHGVDNAVLAQDLQTAIRRGVAYHHSALREISTDLLGVDRYRNMKAFPVVVGMVKKAANKSSAFLGIRAPYPEHYSAGGDEA